MKILMTGGGGFLGQYVQREAECQGHQFISYDMAGGKDILDRDAFMVECMANHPNVVIHAAAVSDLYKSDEDMDKNFSINVMGTYFIGRICALMNIPLIYISTCCAYGNQSTDKTVDETVEPVPTETYAWSKLAGEKALGCVGTIKGFILRLGTFYGPGMRPALFNAVAIDKAVKNESIVVHGDGEQTRQYIHVADVAEAIVKFSEKVNDPCPHPANPLPIFNIIGLKEISVNDTIEMVVRITNNWITAEHVEQRSGQINRQSIDGGRAINFLDWHPKIDYAQGMRECVEKWPKI